MIDGDMPYVVPLSYGYEVQGDALVVYFHCAKAGRKIDILKKNPQICFEMCNEGKPVYAKETPCNSGYYYSSVIGVGKAEFVDDVQEKCHALTLLMKRQADMDIAFNEAQANSVCVFKVVSTDFTGKKKPCPQ